MKIELRNLHHYSDCGYSAYDDFRPGFPALMKGVEEDHVGIVIIREAARITRSAADFFHLVDDLKKHGVRIIVLQEKIDILLLPLIIKGLPEIVLRIMGPLIRIMVW